MQDWSRGGDGIVSLSSIKSIEDLKGQEDRQHAVHARRTSCCSTCSRSRASPPRTGPPSRRTSSSRRTRPAAAAMFKAKQVDAAVTWEPDLSGAVTARGDEAHVLVSTTAATNIIADTLVRAAGPHRPGARDRARLRPRLVRGHRDDQERPGRRRTRRRQGAQARRRDGLRDALGPEAHALRRQRAVLRPRRRQGPLRDALRHRVRHLAQEGPRHARRSTRRTGPTRASSPRSPRSTRARRSRSRRSPRKAPSAKRPRDHQQADPDPLHARLRRDHGRLATSCSTRSARP